MFAVGKIKVKGDAALKGQAGIYSKTVSPYHNLEDKQSKYQADKLFKRLRRKVGHAIGDYGMIEDGDRIMVCVSGGKDSYALLDLLLSLKRSAPIGFDLIPVHLEAGFPGTPPMVVENHLQQVGLPYHIIKVAVYDIAKSKMEPGRPLCPLCSRLRRGYLYRTARELNCNKVALGHHKDDVLATFFLNLFYSGIIKTMPPILRTDDGSLTVIRPLVYCRERDLSELSRVKQYPVLPKDLCRSGEEEQLAAMKKMLREWERTYPKRPDIIFKALKNVVPSHLYDRELFDFSQISNGPRVK